MEKFKAIPNFISYKAGDMGNIKSLKFGKERILKPGVDGRGYLFVVLTMNGLQTTMRVHKLIASSFLGHEPDGTQKLVVNHINNIKTDNRLNNLEVITQRLNCHTHYKGTSKFKGVYVDSKGGYVVRLYNKGKNEYLGRYSSENEAANIYKKRLLQLGFV